MRFGPTPDPVAAPPAVDDEDVMRWVLATGADAVTTNRLRVLQRVVAEGPESWKSAPRPALLTYEELEEAVAVAHELARWAVDYTSSADLGVIRTKAHAADHVTAVDDRRKDEGRMRQVVHDIDRQTDRLCPQRHRNSNVAGACAKNRNHTAEIGRQGIAFGKLDPGRVGGLQSSDIMTAIGREPANARAGRGQQAQFRPRQIAGSDEQHRTGLQIEKYRQKSHTMLASPTYGVDWNYFLYMSHSARAKRKLFLLYCVATIEFSPSKAKGQRCIFPTTTKL